MITLARLCRGRFQLAFIKPILKIYLHIIILWNLCFRLCHLLLTK